jgi:hypothetical protein
VRIDLTGVHPRHHLDHRIVHLEQADFGDTTGAFSALQQHN